jgi:hypothetical protein
LSFAVCCCCSVSLLCSVASLSCLIIWVVSGSCFWAPSSSQRIEAFACPCRGHHGCYVCVVGIVPQVLIMLMVWFGCGGVVGVGWVWRFCAFRVYLTRSTLQTMSCPRFALNVAATLCWNSAVYSSSRLRLVSTSLASRRAARWSVKVIHFGAQCTLYCVCPFSILRSRIEEHDRSTRNGINSRQVT